jgi:cyclin B
MSSQKEITASMRSILIDWLVDVHHKFKLLQETLFLTVNLIDRYLTSHQVLRSKLQLVGVAAMFIASKYEEIYAPELKDFVYVCDKAYAKEEILDMESKILLSV